MAGADARGEVAAIMRRPKFFAVISGVVVLGAIGIALRIDHFVAGAFVPGVLALLIFVICVQQVLAFTPTAVERLKIAAERVDGRFTLWREGSGGHTGWLFTNGAGHQRFGVLNHVVHDVPVEVGHLLAQAQPQAPAATGRRYGYVVLRLPERLPHIVLDSGRVVRILGVRFMPETWHRSQLVEVGGGRRFRLFVADGGEQIAREMFTPELVRLFQQIRRHYDVEIKGRNLYLSSTRSVASGTNRRWRRQQALIDDLAGQMTGSAVWQRLRSGHRGRGTDALRMDEKRAVIIVASVAIAAIVVLSALALYARGIGLLKV